MYDNTFVTVRSVLFNEAMRRPFLRDGECNYNRMNDDRLKFYTSVRILELLFGGAGRYENTRKLPMVLEL